MGINLAFFKHFGNLLVFTMRLNRCESTDAINVGICFTMSMVILSSDTVLLLLASVIILYILYLLISLKLNDLSFGGFSSFNASRALSLSSVNFVLIL